ncbi:MAG: hypothetical protein HYR96_10805 [Deltaproteobacteria bacterium]|nr:hypothetical protein [Deltaproteobacteria bacterium]MBI3293622.1 hypothetical protein [Deltaproteobacteria bacterium]
MPLHRMLNAASSQAADNAGRVASRAWIKVAVIFLIALIARILDAAPAREGETARQESSTSAIFAKDFPFILALGPGLAFKDDKTGWAFNLSGASQINVDYPVFVGLDTAVNIWRPTDEESETAIQILPTAYFLFEVMNSNEFYPYFGISVGPNVVVSSTGTGEQVQTRTNLNFSVLFRPGFAVALASNAWFHFEPKAGIYGGRMIFLPQVTAAFLF